MRVQSAARSIFFSNIFFHDDDGGAMCSDAGERELRERRRAKISAANVGASN